MVQKSKFWQDPGVVDYTMGTDDGTAGYPYLFGDKAGILQTDLAAGEVGSLSTEGIWIAKKDSSAVTIGDAIYWDNDGTDVDGNTGGAASTTASDFALGRAFAAAGTAATTVKVVLNESGAADTITDITDSSTGTASDTIGTFSSAGTDWAEDVDAVKDALATLSTKVNSSLSALRDFGVVKSA